MDIKIVILSSLLISGTYGFNFFNIFGDPKEISPQIVCTGVADGTKLPDDTDCGHFYLCDGGASLRLACRSTEPHFDRCHGTCVNDASVCAITDCTESTESSTTASTTTTSTTTTSTTTTSTTTTTPTTTTGSTTTYHPPTVPTACPVECLPADVGVADCGCPEQWTCLNKVCACDANIQCEMDSATCLETCGCTERCDCDVDDPEKCFCKSDADTIQCPFDDIDGSCVEKCGCKGNCECVTDGVNCTCKDVCSCIEPPVVCPFKPDACVATCGCEERCLCNGLFCKCDLYNACPSKSFWMYQ